MNETFKSELTLLHPGAVLLAGWLAKTTLDTKFHVSNSKNKDLQYNGTFILPNLPTTAPKRSDVNSDLNVPFTPPAQKKRLLKVSLKTVEN